MSKADEMLKLGFYKYLDNEHTLIYKIEKADIFRINVSFDKDMQRYHICMDMFIPKDSETWVAQEFKNEWDKYCSAQGHWQSQMIVDVDIELHKAINEKVKELGWI